MTNQLIPGFEAGYYTLPVELVSASKAEDAITASLEEQLTGGQVAEDALQRFREGVVKAARTGKALPSGKELIEQRIAGEVQDEVVDVLREEARQAERRARTIFGELQLVILTDHLRPALEETIAQAKKATGSELSALGDRYGSIRIARQVLHRLTPSVDTFDMFGEFRNLDALWPEFYPERMREQVRGMVQRSVAELQAIEKQGRPEHTPAPWPEEWEPRWRWILERGECWLPTPDEQSARFEEYLGKARKEHFAEVRAWRDKNVVAS